jgi:glycosyltransferase involved in cell wall biosynthesis
LNTPFSTAIVVFYNNPERYPPTLNSVEELSKRFDRVILITRKLEEPKWSYPANVEVRYSNPAPLKLSALGKLRKVDLFLRFVSMVRAALIKDAPQLCLAQDSIASLASWMVLRFSSKKVRFWYHSHDVTEPSKVGKFSVSWFSVLFEKQVLRKVDLLSLPSMERLRFFKTDHLKGAVAFLPNYPMKKRAESVTEGPSTGDSIKLIYQGHLGRNHGFEAFIEILGETVNDKKVHLSLIGPIAPSYKDLLESEVKKRNKEGFFQLLPPVFYGDLPAVTKAHHVGLAVHIPSNLIYSTGGTASNKIYEYAALGLPVILFDTPHYREILSDYSWAYFTDLSPASILECLKQILENYTASSEKATQDFLESLNYEVAFDHVFQQLEKGIRRNG